MTASERSGGRLVMHVITGLGDGGAEGALYRVCKFDTVDRHVVVSLMDSGKYAEPLEQAGITVHCLGMTRRVVSLGAVWRLWRLVRRYRPDVMQTWLYHADFLGGIIGRLTGVPQVIWGIRHGELEPRTLSRSTMVITHLCARLSPFVPAKIVSCSHLAKQVHVDLGYDIRKFFVIPNGYDLGALAPDPAARVRFRGELGEPDDRLLLGMVARYHAQKDHANLLAALSCLAANGFDFRCVLVGTGMIAANEALVAQIRERGLADHVQLLGRRDDINDVMNGLDIHVLSSVSEAFPNVLAEAMACGTPCVTTDVGDAAYIVGQTGWVVPARDSAALAQAVLTACAERTNGTIWRSRQEACRQRILTCFDIKVVVDAYRSCWSAPDPLDALR